MNDVKYVVEVLSHGTWGISPLCCPSDLPEDAEAQRQMHYTKKGQSLHTRVRKCSMPDMRNLIDQHVKTPGRATVLLPPGLGDIHWVFLKLEGFLAQNGYTGTDVWIWDSGGPRRSAEFVSRVPFVKFVDFMEFRDHHDRRMLHAFCKQTNACMRNQWGFDFVIALNGCLELGLPLESAMDNAPINWEYQINQTEGELRYMEKEWQKGPWMLLYFSGLLAPLFEPKAKKVTPESVASLIRQMQSAWPDHRIVMVGMPWDQGFAEQIHGVTIENLIGKTNDDQYFALLRGADGMIGYANGNTILTTHFGVPTVMIWSREKYPHAGFRTNWAGPRTGYRPVEIEEFDPISIVDTLATLISRRDLVNV